MMEEILKTVSNKKKKNWRKKYSDNKIFDTLELSEYTAAGGSSTIVSAKKAVFCYQFLAMLSFTEK